MGSQTSRIKKEELDEPQAFRKKKGSFKVQSKYKSRNKIKQHKLKSNQHISGETGMQ
jgi:hypothetical protein